MCQQLTAYLTRVNKSLFLFNKVNNLPPPPEASARREKCPSGAQFATMALGIEGFCYRGSRIASSISL